MTTYKISFIIFGIIGSISCNRQGEYSLQEGTTNHTSASYASEDNIINNSIESVPEENFLNAGSMSLAQNTTNSTSNTALNPEHGQPGHRCDIPVGAPLNSTPSSTPTQANPSNSMTISSPTMNTQNATVPQNSKTASGLNPEHGQPGHRCDIPVGAPLNSAPASNPSVTPAPAPKSNTIIPQKTVSPLIAAPATSSESTSALNPEHGQPGHRCDIPVGAPLDTPANTDVPE